MAYDGEAQGFDDNSHHAAQGANSDWHGVPRGAKPDLKSEVLGPQRTNRRWDPQEKARITAESFEPGANVSAIARRHGVGLGLLHYWRRTARDRGAFEPISIVPIAVKGDASSARVTGDIEIEIGGARVRVRALVDGNALRIVLEALRGR